MEIPTTVTAERSARAARPDAELVSIFDAQREAFRKNPYPPYAERIETLKALEAMLKKHRRRAEEASRRTSGRTRPSSPRCASSWGRSSARGSRART